MTDFIDNPVIHGREDRYAAVTVDVARIMKSWRLSLFSYEWVLPDGRIRDLTELPEAEKPKRQEVEPMLDRGQPIERPVLGIGLMDNVEIGSGRAIFLTLAARGAATIPVHIPKSSLKEFAPFLV